MEKLFTKEDLRKAFFAGEVKIGNISLNLNYNQKLPVKDFDKWFDEYYGKSGINKYIVA